jgi:hypothetical protein
LDLRRQAVQRTSSWSVRALFEGLLEAAELFANAGSSSKAAAEPSGRDPCDGGSLTLHLAPVPASGPNCFDALQMLHGNMPMIDAINGNGNRIGAWRGRGRGRGRGMNRRKSGILR